jgi:O-acetyl-ADP-ribose deacetylase (regulator of RNase III)
MQSTVPDPGPGRRPPPGLPAGAAFTARYELLGEVGRGGMGVVYRARHKGLDMPVAIKVTLPSAPAERFLREARLLARVKSPYVVAVHDFDVLPDGCPVLVMEWVEGANLDRLIRACGGPLPEGEVAPWMRQACEGMLAAAAEGIIHRDLKPSNLLVDGRGRARVADFGLARDPAGPGELSLTGLVMGTPLYMAPEQAEDPRGVDTRADVYSFGATFYHALTGRPPFEGATAFAVLYKHKAEPLVSPRARVPALSGRVSDLLERCLAKAPADRFPSFAELLKHLQPAPAAPSPWVASDDPELAAYLERYQARRASYLAERRAWNEDLDVYTFPRAQTLRVVRGDLVAQRVDALVNSETCYFAMDYGVSAAVREAGGPEVADQLARQGPARAGRAVVTSAGALPARLVFHGVTAGYVRGQPVRASRDLIAEIMASCFYHADTYEVRSIAFPLLATGAQGFPRDVCLDAMFQFLARTFLRGLTSVREARVVLYRWPEEEREAEAALAAGR